MAGWILTVMAAGQILTHISNRLNRRTRMSTKTKCKAQEIQTKLLLKLFFSYFSCESKRRPDTGGNGETNPLAEGPNSGKEYQDQDKYTKICHNTKLTAALDP